MDRANSSVELEIESHVLPQTKRLSDNSFEKIFTRNRRNESGIFTYNCHLCQVASLPGERAVQTHITGKKHQQRLQFDYVPDSQQFRAPIAVKAKTQAVYFPGEPAPPGFEDEVDTMSVLDSIAKHACKPLIGLEYVVELVDVNAKEPFFICTLCDKKCDPRNILPQITSHRHRMKYLDFHFPSFMALLNREQKFNMDMTYREDVLTQVSSMIEKKNGHTKPTICECSRYEKNREIIEGEIKRKKHFSEEDWPECEKVFLAGLKVLRNAELDNVSSDEDDEYHDARSKRKPLNKPVFNRLAPIKQDSLAHRPKLLTPRELQEESNTKFKETYIVEKYKAQVEIAIKELEKTSKEYEKSPERHPSYSEEWKNFWSRKYKELLGQGKDANSYDYKPEWIEFWTERMIQLHKIEIDKKKELFRKKLGLSIDAISKIESAPPSRERRRSRSRSPRAMKQHRRSKSPMRIVEISDDSDDDRPRRSVEPKLKRQRSDYLRNSEERSRSRFSDDSPYSRSSDYRSKDAYDSKYYSSRNRDYDRNHLKSKSPEVVDEGPINLISVCRLLSALESELGLLAKSILDLLAKAVGFEKSKPNSADELLFTFENCNILETVREKLKGVLSANLISSNKVSAVKRAVQNISQLLHEVSLRKPVKSTIEIPKVSMKINDDESLNDSMDPVAAAKMQIAMVITESLMKEGRIDVSAEELEALVESFMSSANDESLEEEEEEKMEIAQKTQAVEVKSVTQETAKPETSSSVSGLENLTDEDLQTLLRNFADLTSDEQSHLIAYLSKIEQTNPTRVEKLRKYVNIGDADDADFDENKDEDLDMDLAAGVVEISPRGSFKKSPELRQVLSEDDDEDFNDEQMAKKLGQTHHHNADKSRSANHSNSTGHGNALKDNLGLADSLMSSLLQSSMPKQSANSWPVQSGIDMSTAFYQQHQMPQYQENMSIYEQQLAMNNIAMGMQMPQSENPWPQSAASNFFQESTQMYAPVESKNLAEFNNLNSNSRDKVAFRKRYENPNNRQLTGKGKQRK